MADIAHGRSPHTVSKAGLLDTLSFLWDVALPTFAKGPIIRRRSVVAAAERSDLDDKAVKRMQLLRHKYGPGPLLLRVPLRRHIVILASDDVQRILHASPEPFALASMEKRSALNHFEPKNVLASRGADRAERRHFNEAVLETGCQMHSMAARFHMIIDKEMAIVAEHASNTGELTWDHFFEGWYAMVRHLVLGPSARDDRQFTDLLEKLRYRANYAFLKPKDKSARAQMLTRLKAYMESAEPDSLASRAACVPKTEKTQPHQQAPQWLFAFDPAGMATYRALALLSAHPAAEQEARREISDSADNSTPRLSYLRACFLEALRLWPTTPAIFREATRKVEWGRGAIPDKASVLIYTPFFHRDAETLPFAHKLQPDLWIDEENPGQGLVPFSRGPGVCPASDFVPMVASLALASLMKRVRIRLSPLNRLDPVQRLPGTLDNYRLRFSVEPLRAGATKGAAG